MTAAQVLLAAAAAVACAAALRSTWSPCGLSVLSTMTPLAERGRGHRFTATASWFVVGALGGGASLGLLAAVGAAAASAAGVAASGPGAAGVALGLAAAASAAGAAFDLRVFGLRLPIHRRQVNEDWLDRYRPWVYGAGFGWQIGSGLATYVMTAAVYLTVVLAALAGSPPAALGVGALFGFVRGLAILFGAGITGPARLVSFHRRLEALGEPVRIAVAGVQGLVAVLASGAAGGWLAAALVAVGLGGAGVLGGARARGRSAPRAPSSPRAPCSPRAPSSRRAPVCAESSSRQEPARYRPFPAGT